MNKDKLRESLVEYFGLNNPDGSYTYELTRVKSAFDLGTMTFDDFKEFDDEQIDDLTEFLFVKFYQELLKEEVK